MYFLRAYIRPIFGSNNLMVNATDRGEIKKLPKLAALGLIIALTCGFTFAGWQSDKILSNTLSINQSIVPGTSHQDFAVRTLSLEDRDAKETGVLDERVQVVTSTKVEAFGFEDRHPSFYSLKAQIKSAIRFRCGRVRLPATPLELNQVLRI